MQILKKKKFNLAIEDQGHEVEHSQCCHSMANIKIYKRIFFFNFHDRSHRLRDINTSNVFLGNEGQGMSTTSAMALFGNKFRNVVSPYNLFTMTMTVRMDPGQN